MRIYSPNFEDGGELAECFTQEADDLSPELVFEDIPAGTRSLVLIADDPDAPDPAAPKRLWLHWLVVNLPAGCPGLPRGVRTLPAPARAGINDGDVTGYSGPLPPIGRHRYYFKLFALDCSIDVPDGFRRPEVEAAMAGHVLAQAQCMGTYIHSKNR